MLAGKKNVNMFVMSLTHSPSKDVNPTAREVEILKLIVTGATAADIAEGLFISRTTVNNHVQKILQKLNAHTRPEAVRKAERTGLI
jgi:DNA-binding NarL/FixJ family response regulator